MKCRREEDIENGMVFDKEAKTRSLWQRMLMYKVKRVFALLRT